MRGAKRATEKAIKREIEHLYRVAAKLYKEGYVEEALAVSKSMVRLAFKHRMGRHAFRLACRKCLAPLIPGLTLSYRIKRKSGKSYILRRCNVCGYSRKKVFKRKGAKKSGGQASGKNSGKSGR